VSSCGHSSTLVLGTAADNVANSSGCPLCSDRNIYKELTKKTIKEEILRKLGFSTAPNVTAELFSQIPFVQEQIKQLERETEQGQGMQSDQSLGFHYMMDEDDFHFQPQTISILPSKPPFNVWDQAPLFFKLTERVVDSRQDLVKSVLNIHLPAATSPSQTRAIIHIFYVSVDKKSGKAFVTKAKENKIELRQDRGGRVDINVLRLTRIWMKNPDENFGLLVRVQVDNVNETGQVVGKNEVPIGQVGTSQGPYLKIDIHDGAWRGRTKRTTNRVCREEYEPDVTQCCMWPLKIDFDEFGWDWVLFPRDYDANFCSGDCSLGVVSEYPHTTLMQLNPDTGLHSSTGPCCAPRKMSAINMLYLDQDSNVILGKLPSMRVERCGCS